MIIIDLVSEIFSSFQNIFSLKNQIGDKEKLGGKLSEDEESKIEEVINEKIKWLEDNPVSCLSQYFPGFLFLN